MVYRRSVAIELQFQKMLSSPPTEPLSFDGIEPHDLSPLIHEAGKPSQLKGRKTDDEDEEMALFRRVRINTSIFLPAMNSRPGSPASVFSSISDDGDYETTDVENQLQDGQVYYNLKDTPKIKDDEQLMSQPRHWNDGPSLPYMTLTSFQPATSNDAMQ
jgi:hypothetical protein